MDISGRVVLITGASAGIGLATARVELAAEHIRVISIFPRMVATGFHTRSLGNREMHRRYHANPNAPVDSAEHVAERILAAAINEPEEQYVDA